MPSIKLLSPSLALALLLLSTLPFAASAQVPADEVLKDFLVNGDFLVVADGQKLADAEIFFSQRAVAYLILSPDLSSPLLLQLRARTLETVDPAKIIEQGDGAKAILADAELVPAGAFTLEKQEVVFKFDDKELAFKKRPWLLGKHKAARLKEHNPEYAFKASRYTPVAEDIKTLQGQNRTVKVRVYFGSWCPHCKEMVPRILRIDDEIGDAKIEFEYFGLFSPLGQDGQARADNVHRVPTAVVYIDGQEYRRTNDLAAPERSLAVVLGLPVSSASE